MFQAAWWLALLACDVEMPDSSQYGGELVPQHRAWIRARRALASGRRCFRGDEAYCPKDEAFTDGVIQYVLDRNFDGLMPNREQLIHEVLDEAAGVYRRSLREEAGLAATMEAIQARYEDPTIEKVPGQGLSVDVGVPPGELTWEDERFVLRSPLVDREEWVGTEAARVLARYLEEYPKLPGVQITVEVPTGPRDFAELVVRYARGVDRIVIYRPGNDFEAWATPELGGDLQPYIDGLESLHTSDLIRCTTHVPGGPPRCPR